VWVAASTVQQLHARRRHPGGGRETRQLDTRQEASRHLRRNGLRYSRRHPQRGRVVEGHQWPTRHRHVAQGNRDLGDHAGKGRAHDIEPTLSSGCTGLRQLRAGLRLRRFELGLGTLQRGLADVAFLEELLLALEVPARHLQ